jgi:ribosomal protein S25
VARTPSFNFGANRKASKAKAGKKARTSKGKSGKGKDNAWRAYVGVSNSPIPD